MHPYFAGPVPHILAHRGLAIATAENSLEAFEAAIAAGATHIETDVHLTSDGYAVLFHDDVFDGVNINDVPLSQLPQSVTLLGHALEKFPETRFNIDVKDHLAIPHIISAVNASNAQERVLITSFSEKRRQQTASHLPHAATSASARLFVLALLAAKLGFRPGVKRILRDIDALQIPARVGKIKTITPRTMRAYKSAGVIVHVWTVNDPQRMLALRSLGVDGIVTDRTDIAVEVLRPSS